MRTTLLAASFLRASSLLLVVQAFVPQQHHQVPGRTSLSFAPQILYSPVKSVGLCMSSSSNEVENEKASDVAELSNDANGLSSHAHAADVNGATLGDIETSSSSTQMNGDTTNGVVTNGDATSVAKDEEPSSEPYQPRTVNVNLDLDIDNEVFEGISQKLREEVVGPMFGPDIEKAVPGDTLKGAALLGIGLSALIGNDVVLSSALGLVSAYVAIQPGPFGNFFRTAGKTTWSTLTGVGGLFKRIVTNNKVTAVTKGLLSSRNKGGSSSKDIDNVIAETEALLKEVDNDVSIPYDAPARLAYHTMCANDGTGFDHVKFEKFKKQYVKNAIADVIRKRGGTVPEDDEDDGSRSEVMVDVSVPYDAPARLAYDKMYSNEAFNQAKFEAFKLEYVENAIAQVVQKTMQERVVSAEKAEQERQQKAEAEAKAAAEEEARMVEEMARLAAEEEAARLAAEQAEADLVAEQARLQAEEEEAARVKAEEAKLAEEARLAAEKVNEEDEDRIDKDDWDASIKLAQQLAEDTIAGVDIGTMNLEDGPTSSSSSTAAPAKADTDDGVDMEELGRLAREAVEAFEAQYEMEEEQMQDEKKAWNENMQQTSAAPSTESKTDWKKLTVVKLKEELKSRGLTPKGKKADLVAMLEEYEAAPAADLVSDAQEVLAESQEVFAKMDQANDEIEQMLMLMNDDILDATEPSDADLAELAATAEEIYAPSSGGGDPFAGEDMEAIARAAREAVQKFEADNGDGEYVIEQQQQDGGNQTWEEMSVVELKDELRNRGLRVGGRKAELIERLKKAEEA